MLRPSDGLTPQQRFIQNNPERYRYLQRSSLLRRKYGMTVEDFQAMVDDQNNECAICHTGKPGGNGTWHVDHNHTTGKVRGLLCSNCNRGLGHFQDSRTFLCAAIDYLDRHDETIG